MSNTLNPSLRLHIITHYNKSNKPPSSAMLWVAYIMSRFTLSIRVFHGYDNGAKTMSNLLLRNSTNWTLFLYESANQKTNG